jgi:cell division protein FtsX
VLTTDVAFTEVQPLVPLTLELEGATNAEVFMRVHATDDEIRAVEDLLGTDADVASYDFVDTEAAYREFARIFEDSPELIENVAADALPASFRVVVDAADLDAFEARYQGEPGVDRVVTPAKDPC